MVRSFSELRNISSQIGNNIDFVQGAGGNTSVKEDGVLWIKASGCWLSDAIELVYFGLDEFFDYVVTSEEAGADKPDKRPFEVALEKLIINIVILSSLRSIVNLKL